MKQVLVLAVSLAAVSEVRAQGFALNRYQPSPAGDPFFGVASAATGATGLRASFGADYAHAPLVLRTTPDRREAGAIVDGQLNLHAGLSLALAHRALLSLDVPVAVLNSGDSPTADGARLASPGSAALGDLRAGARLRLLGDHHFALAAAASLWLPTGSRAQYTGDGHWRPGAALLAGGRAARVLWAASAGIERRWAGELTRLRMAEVLTGAVALGVLLADDFVLLGAELAGATVLGEDRRQATNLESLLGLHLRGRQLTFGVGAGPGLSIGTGTPDVRLLATAGYAGGPRPTPPAPAPPVLVVARAPEPPPPQEPAAPPPPAPEAPVHVRVSQTEIVIAERIEFEPGSARLDASWATPLGRVARTMNEHVEVQRVEIEGHTDARERPHSGLELAKQRADAVRAWLVEHGIDPRRLAARAYGRARPVAENGSQTGRARNRRVEFRIVSLTADSRDPGAPAQ
jgi:outer membrane protein OmpA-like peptidoglycan-associated protein